MCLQSADSREQQLQFSWNNEKHSLFSPQKMEVLLWVPSPHSRELHWNDNSTDVDSSAMRRESLWEWSVMCFSFLKFSKYDLWQLCIFIGDSRPLTSKFRTSGSSWTNPGMSWLEKGPACPKIIPAWSGVPWALKNLHEFFHIRLKLIFKMSKKTACSQSRPINLHNKLC